MRLSSTISFIVMLGVLSATPAWAQDMRVIEDDPWCESSESNGNVDQHRICEVREITLTPSGRLVEVDGRTNGGVSVHGWNRDEIRVRARVTVAGRGPSAAEDIMREVDVETGGQRIRAEGPRTRSREWFSVSYEVSVPVQSDVRIETHNGGIEIADVHGDIDFTALNGGVRLSGLAGDVQGRTTNGALDVELVGTEWEGAGMDVRTTNGAVRLRVPEDYSASLESGTVNGVIDVDFPVTVRGRIGRTLSAELGEGGRTISARTTNGAVHISRI